ncbi:MAG: hypothetical protein EXR73_09290 [Myxococcales bacterium]|nr:hypothetical protein [Myxococcales bacterium]
MFKEALQGIVENVDGGLAGLVMGFDGIAVDSFTRAGRGQPGVDVNTMGMEFSFVLGQVRKAAQVLELGDLGEVSIRTERMTLVVRVLTPQYFLALVLAPDGNLGKGRYLMRLAAPRLQQEL